MNNENFKKMFLTYFESDNMFGFKECIETSSRNSIPIRSTSNDEVVEKFTNIRNKLFPNDKNRTDSLNLLNILSTIFKHNLKEFSSIYNQKVLFFDFKNQLDRLYPFIKISNSEIDINDSIKNNKIMIERLQETKKSNYVDVPEFLFVRVNLYDDNHANLVEELNLGNNIKYRLTGILEFKNNNFFAYFFKNNEWIKVYFNEVHRSKNLRNFIKLYKGMLFYERII